MPCSDDARGSPGPRPDGSRSAARRRSRRTRSGGTSVLRRARGLLLVRRRDAPYLNDGSSCQRSAYAYPSLIAAAKGYALNFRACSGATVADVTNSQLSALSAANAYVTISVGGNDAGFASVLTTCAQPSWLSNCTGAVDGAQRYITNTLPGSLATLYASIRAKAPNAKVVVVGYPRIFNGTDCNLLTWFSGSEMTRLNQTADQLDSTIAAAAASAGFGFVSPVPAFVGHAVCDRPEWINGLSSPITESFHPNRSGQASGYTPLVSPALVGATGRRDAGRPPEGSGVRGPAGRAAAVLRGVDATITPKRFVAPALPISSR